MIETLRPMKDIPLGERQKILADYAVLGSREVRRKWNISQNVLSHIKFFHGKSSAKSRGYYHKDLTEGIVDPRIEKIKELKQQGKNSLEVSIESGISLEKINHIWPTL